MRYDGKSNDLINSEYHAYAPMARIQTSPRRALSALVNNYTFPEQWHDFENKHGSSLKEDELARAYQNNNKYLQLADIEAASKGDAKALKKIQNRSEYMLKRLLCIYGMIDPERIAPLLRRTGIKTTTPPGEWNFEITPDNRLKNITGFEIDMAGTNLKRLFSFFGFEAEPAVTAPTPAPAPPAPSPAPAPAPAEEPTAPTGAPPEAAANPFLKELQDIYEERKNELDQLSAELETTLRYNPNPGREANLKHEINRIKYEMKKLQEVMAEANQGMDKPTMRFINSITRNEIPAEYPTGINDTYLSNKYWK